MIARPEGASIVSFTPETEEERTWIDDNVGAETWQWFGATLHIDARFAQDIANGMAEEGFAITLG